MHDFCSVKSRFMQHQELCSAKSRCEGLQYCLQVVAICSYVRARTSMPHLVALVAAEEVVDESGQQACCSAGQLAGLNCLLRL